MQPHSPWHGLTPSEAAELADALSTPDQHTRTAADALRVARIQYALRCTDAIAGNDLTGALRASHIATAAAALTLSAARITAGQQPNPTDTPNMTGRAFRNFARRPALRAESGSGR
jgi:hypothetical protein